MYRTILLNDIRELRYRKSNLPFPRTRIPLHSMIINMGVEMQEGEEEYSWHGLKRGNAEFIAFQYTLSGRGHLRVENQEWELQAGDAMLLHFPADNHYWLEKGDQWEFFFVSLNGTEVLRQWRQAILRTGPVASWSLEDPFIQKVAHIVRKGIQGEIKSAWESSSLAYEITMSLLDKVYPEDRMVERLRAPEIARAIKFCRENYYRSVGLDDMARVAGQSRYHFSRKFKESEGISPVEFLTRERIRKAISLLQTTVKPLVEISEATGFTDVNYFCRVFRKTMGISPGAFRKRGMF